MPITLAVLCSAASHTYMVMMTFRTLTGIFLACSLAGCLSTRPSPLSIDSGNLLSLKGAHCFALYGPDESVAVLRAELRKRLPDVEFVSANVADVIINFNGNTPMVCIDCGEGWRPGFFSRRSAFASIERYGCVTESSRPFLVASWSNQSYSLRRNARELVALLYPHLVGRTACSCNCGQRTYIFPDCGEEASNATFQRGGQPCGRADGNGKLRENLQRRRPSR